MKVRTTATALALMASLAGMAAWAQTNHTSEGATTADSASWEQRVSDAWIGGRLEAVYALNRHLNPFKIQTTVNHGMVTLSGMVESDIDRDLAEEIAKGIDGVKSVENALTVDSSQARRDSDQSSDPNQRKFGQWVDDATTTAAVKSKLVANSNVPGIEIDVDTRYDVVTLSGQVGSKEQRALAEQLARNTGDVRDVRNELSIKSGS